MRHRFTLRFRYIVRAFVVLLVTFLVIVLALVISDYLGYLQLSEYFAAPQITPISTVALLCIAGGTTAFAMNLNNLIRPIDEMRRATKRVAAGDFSVQVDGGKIPELGELAGDFNRMVEELGNIETLRSDFITNISHEIKNPIGVIEGCLELLRSPDLTSGDMEEYLRLMETSTRRLSTVTTGMLQLTALENEEALPERRKYALDEQLRQAILQLEPQWSAKGIELDIDLQAVTVEGYKDLYFLVWINLLENAIKYSDDGGGISVSLRRARQRSVVRIADSGTGMNESVKLHLFDKFYQGDTSRASEGYGLGLAIVKRIIELTGAEIQVESQLGTGSVFTVMLPAQ